MTARFQSTSDRFDGRSPSGGSGRSGRSGRSRSARRARASALTFAAALRSATGPGSAGLGTRLAALPRLVRSALSGRYSGTTLGRLGLAVLGLAYLVSPVDLVPEAVLPFVGLVDDAVVAGWLATVFVAETERFLVWEQGDHGGEHDDRVVRSHVVV